MSCQVLPGTRKGEVWQELSTAVNIVFGFHLEARNKKGTLHGSQEFAMEGIAF